MGISVLLNSELSRYEIYSDGQLAGFADFKMRGTTMVFPHTEIDPNFGGKGLGSALIEYALDDAAAKKLIVAPYCPFVSKFIGKNPDKYLFLVDEAERAKFGL
jgi:predicted GNAT family acetyltransferase